MTPFKTWLAAAIAIMAAGCPAWSDMRDATTIPGLQPRGGVMAVPNMQFPMGSDVIDHLANIDNTVTAINQAGVGLELKNVDLADPSADLAKPKSRQDDGISDALSQGGTLRDALAPADFVAENPSAVDTLRQIFDNAPSKNTDLPGTNPLINPDNLKEFLPSGFKRENWTPKLNLHLHSYYSDGTLSPTALVQDAYNHGLRYIAISDHDTDEGYDEAAKEVKRINEAHPKDPIELFSGIEFSSYGGAHIQVLAYDRTNKLIRDALKHNQDNRIIRMELMIDALNQNPVLKEKNIQITMDDVRAKAKGVLAEPHLARVVVEDYHLAKDLPEAFDRFINDARRKSEDDPRVHAVEVGEIVKAAKAAGGMSSLNHPHTLFRLDFKAGEDKVKSILETGINGIEGGYRADFRDLRRPDGSHEQMLEKILKWAHQVMMPDNSKHGLFVLAGSDFHDPDPDNHLEVMNTLMPLRLAEQVLDHLHALKSAVDSKIAKAAVSVTDGTESPQAPN